VGTGTHGYERGEAVIGTNPGRIGIERVTGEPADRNCAVHSECVVDLSASLSGQPSAHRYRAVAVVDSRGDVANEAVREGRVRRWRDNGHGRGGWRYRNRRSAALRDRSADVGHPGLPAELILLQEQSIVAPVLDGRAVTAWSAKGPEPTVRGSTRVGAVAGGDEVAIRLLVAEEASTVAALEAGGKPAAAGIAIVSGGTRWARRPDPVGL